jgi:amino acid adenylation domain-containing protein
VVTAPVANRTRRDMEGLIGYFANDLPLRTRVGGDPGFPELLDRIHETALGAWAHQSLPLSKILQDMGEAAPVVRAYFQLLNTPMPDFALTGLTLSPFDLEARIATFDLAMITREVEGGIDGQLIASRELFLPPTARALLRGFLVLVEGILDNPDRRLSELPLLAPEERHALLHEWNPAGACAGATPLHRAFEAVVAARPDAPAVTCEGVTLTYGELDRRAEALARSLRGRGVGPESRVGLRLERSPELVVGILGILKTGGAYVPLDPDYPRERLNLLVEDSRLDALVTAETLRLAGPHPRPLSQPHSHPAGRGEQGGGALSREAGEGWGGGGPDPDHLAYVIYTSGSTGRPKGVMVTHRQAARLFEATRRFGFGPDDVWTLFHSYAFDFSVWELWGALLHGGRLVIVPRWVARSPEAFLDLLVDEGVTVLNQTPSAFYELARAEEARGAGRPLRLRWVLFGGEALEPPKLLPWLDRHGDTPALVNLYGITETTVHATLRPLIRADAGSSASVLGRPLDDLRIHLLGPAFEMVPVVAIGEIFVGGGGVARGYLGRPDLTAERFVPDPLSNEPGARLYRSGDLARRRSNGELEYRGRADQQLKIRGFRIEPGEVEAALVRHPAVAQAAVFARRLSAEDVRLVAAIVPHGEAPSSAELRDHLLAALPEPWVPSLFVTVPALPLTTHGKVDRRALAGLAELAERAVATGPAAATPLTPLEEILARLWADLLEVDHVGRDDNFFALGGHSLLITRVAARIRKDFGVTLPMRSFFDRPTVANLSASLLAELAARLAPGRLEALVAQVQGLSDAEVGRLLGERRAGVLLLAEGAAKGPSPRGGGGWDRGEARRGAAASAKTPLSESGPAPLLSSPRSQPSPSPGGGTLRLALQGESARVLDVLAVLEVLPKSPPAPPLQVTTLAVPTCNRPEVLERGLASHAEVARERGRALRFAVLDDSPDPAVRREYRERLAALGRRFGAEIVYAGLEEKRRFRAALEAEGIPPAAVAAALCDPEGVGVPVGANRNAVLLQTVGEGALSIDDDTLARGGPPPEVEPGVAFLSGTAPGTAFLSGRDPGAIRGFASREEALSAIALRPVDLPGIHEALLGRGLRDWLGGLDPAAPAALDRGDPGFLRSLESGGRVLVTTNGWAGDCGWRSPTFYLLLAGDSWRRLAASAEGYRTVTASKEIVRFVPRPTLGNGDSFMATLFTGLDNRQLLPPFPPVLWGEDLLFGVTLQLAFPAARVGHLPWVATHEPMEHRAFWPGEMVRSASGIDHSRLVSALLAGFEPGPAGPTGRPAESLRRLGAFLQDLGRMAPADFDERARQAVGDRAEAFAAELETRLAECDASLEGAGLWADDARRYLDLLRRHAGAPEFAVPLDLLYGREPGEAMRLAQKLIANHGLVLAHWPDLVEAARALKARGQGLAEPVEGRR